jgi:hypothetical protein
MLGQIRVDRIARMKSHEQLLEALQLGFSALVTFANELVQSLRRPFLRARNP